MKRLWSVIILVVVFGLLFGAYKLVEKKETKETDTTDKTIKLFEMNRDKINEVAVENSEGKLLFKKKDTEWTIVEPAGLKIISSKVENIAMEMSSFNAEKLVEKDAKDLSVYGLDKPSVITAKIDNSEVRTIELGNETPKKNGYYVKLPNSKDVYTVSSYKGGLLAAKKNDLRDKELFAITPEDVKGFSMERGGKVVFSAKKVTDTEWELTEPIEASVNMSSLDSIFNTIRQPYALDYIDENPKDLKKYGLDNPSYSFEVESKNGKTKVLLGDEKVKGSQIYAKLANKADVFTLDEQVINFVDKPLKDMVQVFAYLADIKNVTRVDVNMDGKTVTSTIQLDAKGETDKDKFTVDGKEANMKDDVGKPIFKNYYEALIGITMSDLELDAKPSGKPEITLTYYLKQAPGIMKLEFIKKNENYYYVKRNGKYSSITVPKEKFDEVRTAYKNLTDEINKKK